MKDSETIKDIVPFFFSFGEDKVFLVIFSFLLRRTEKKRTKNTVVTFSVSFTLIARVWAP
jgi:glycopeptide antibiotics resistance protein